MCHGFHILYFFCYIFIQLNVKSIYKMFTFVYLEMVVCEIVNIVIINYISV